MKIYFKLGDLIKINHVGFKNKYSIFIVVKKNKRGIQIFPLYKFDSISEAYYHGEIRNNTIEQWIKEKYWEKIT